MLDSLPRAVRCAQFVEGWDDIWFTHLVVLQKATICAPVKPFAILRVLAQFLGERMLQIQSIVCWVDTNTANCMLVKYEYNQLYALVNVNITNSMPGKYEYN